MCTILVGLGTDPRWPLVIAANRDEALRRRSSGPGILSTDPPIFGGRDLEAGGTWMGVTGGGFFVGLTNQRPRGGYGAAELSRGQVVLDVLQDGALEPATERLAGLDVEVYHPFNLIFGDARELRVAYARPGRPVRIEQVAPGFHVLPNGLLDDPRIPKVERARALTDGRLETMEAALADTHTPADLPPRPPLIPGPIHAAIQRLCVRTPTYGTVSASSFALEPGRVARYRYAAGPPDRAPFGDVDLPYGDAVP